MKVRLDRNQKRREAFRKLEKENAVLRILSNNSILSNREEYHAEAIKNRGKGRISEIRNICIRTGRSRGLIRRYKYSRIMFKNSALRGYLSGVRKRS
jgi:small subunit ribosomal protein S14